MAKLSFNETMEIYAKQREIDREYIKRGEPLPPPITSPYMWSDYFHRDYLEEKLKLARRIWAFCMVFSVLFRGAGVAWLFGTFYIIYYHIKETNKAIDHDRRWSAR